MGIHGLWPFLEKAANNAAERAKAAGEQFVHPKSQVPLSELGGHKRLLIDTSMLMHKCAYGLEKEIEKGSYVLFRSRIAKRLKVLRALNVDFMCVLDGASGAAKAGEDAKRNEAAAAASLANKGHFRVHRQVNIAVLAEVRKLVVAYMVAPNEADHQMPFLQRAGIADTVWAEDGDMMAHGMKKQVTAINFDFDNHVSTPTATVWDFTNVRVWLGTELMGAEALARVPAWFDFRHIVQCWAALAGCDYGKVNLIN